MKTEGGEIGGTGGNSRGEERVGRWGEREVIAVEDMYHSVPCQSSDNVSVYFRHYHYETCQSLSITLSVSDIPFCDLSEFTLFSVCFRLQQFRD